MQRPVEGLRHRMRDVTAQLREIARFSNEWAAHLEGDLAQFELAMETLLGRPKK